MVSNGILKDKIVLYETKVRVIKTSKIGTVIDMSEKTCIIEYNDFSYETFFYDELELSE